MLLATAGSRRGLRSVAMEFIIGLGIMAVIWIVVIYGSEYVNQNVQ
jgi:hypothetical protein